MAYFELNALSTVLGGSFTARCFLPDPQKLAVDDSTHTKTYPVLWLLHTDGKTSLEFMKSDIEELAHTYGFVAVAPDMHHAMGTDMKWGPNYEKFITKELRGIMKHILPIDTTAENNYIGGIGTGGYAAVKCGLKHPDLFSKAFSIDGVVDMAKTISAIQEGEEKNLTLSMEALDAIFGDVDQFPGSSNDLFGLAEEGCKLPVLLAVQESSSVTDQNVRLQTALGENASLCQVKTWREGLESAVAWLKIGRE